MKNIRKHIKGWRLKRYIERHRYYLLMKWRKRHRSYKRKKDTGPYFKCFTEDLKFLTVVSKAKNRIKVGNEFFTFPQGSLIIKLPRIFDFDKNYSDSAQVIDIFRRALQARRRISYINFEEVEDVSPACMMAFSAYADMWKMYAPNVKTKTQTWHPEVARRFSEIGFFKMLGFPEPANKSEDGPVKFMPIRSNAVCFSKDVDVGHDSVCLQKDIENFIGRSLEDVRMYDSVSEAVRNIWDHAYKGMKRSRLPFKWWVSVAYENALNVLRIIVFDHGMGIPTTIKTSNTFSLYQRIINNWSEGARLYLAFERERRKINKRARSLIVGRGHGCPDIARLVSANDENMVRDGSSLTVLSGRARYRLNGGTQLGRGSKEDLPKKLQGTMIEWKICL